MHLYILFPRFSRDNEFILLFSRDLNLLSQNNNCHFPKIMGFFYRDLEITKKCFYLKSKKTVSNASAILAAQSK